MIARTNKTGGRGRQVARAFTIVEMILVVAIMVLITLGVAQVFRVTGDTVKAGRRVSNLNVYAAMIEKQMRADFTSATRDGFMVMRHRNAGHQGPNFTNATVALAPGDTSPRRRRGDDVVFFRYGDFSSKRDPVYPTRQARSTQARIYYGLGLRKNPADATYRDPIVLDDTNSSPATTGLGAAGPNQYASSWMLLRHETLLCQPKGMVDERLPTTLVDPAPVYNGGNPLTVQCEDLDSQIQISLQPAASGIFRHLLPLEPANGSQRFGNAYVVRDDMSAGGPARPQFASGVIDIATTDLSEIRAILLDAQLLTAGGTNPFSFEADGDTGSYFPVDLAPENVNSVTRIMHSWMREAFPSALDAGVRMRFEDRPPDFRGHLGTGNANGYTREYHRTDQNMLTAFNFVPGCAEFIVEWSFGKSFPYNDPDGRAGQLIWHGLERDGGRTRTGATAFAALPYGDVRMAGIDLYQMPYRRLDGSTGYWPPNEDDLNYPNRHVVREAPSAFGNASTVEYSYFGYIDPTYRLRSMWTDENGDGFAVGPDEIYEDVNRNNNQDAEEPTIGNGDIWFDVDGSTTERLDPREPQTIPWPWPKLVRITMSIVDPTEPLREQTFQFVFEMPPAQGDVQ